MGVYWLPFTIDEQVKVLQGLLKISFLDYEERIKLEQIEHNLSSNRFLTNEESRYLKLIINRYGYTVNFT